LIVGRDERREEKTVMSGSVRTHFAAGVTAVAVAATAISPTTPSALQATRLGASSAPVELTAAVKPLVPTPLPPLRAAQLKTAYDAIVALDPQAARHVANPAAAVAPQNAVSNFIVTAYQAIQPWVDYGVDLAQYVLQFIPFGGLIGAQVNIVYYQLIRPISDSVVYDLVVPVVNDPLNPASYVNGLIAVGATSVKALVNTGIAEANYFLGWLIPPIPPLPFAATITTATTLKTTTLATQLETAVAKGPLAGLAALATDVDEHVQALVPKPRDALRALESALHPARTQLTTDTIDTDDADARPDGAINKFVKRLTANSPRATVTSEKSDAQSSARKPLRQLKDAIRAATKPKTDASGAKDRSPRAPRHAKADAKN
jgi:hypothetical protein